MFPVFNWGQAGIVLIAACFVGLIAIFDDPLLALYMGVGAYVGLVINMLRVGSAPNEVEIQECEIGPISSILNSSPYLTPIEDRIWASSRYKSWLWKSDWVSITEEESGKFRLKATRRDLKIILAKIRPQR